MPPKMKKKRFSKMDVDDDLEEWKKSKQLLKPKDQVELQDFELKEVLARSLVTTNNQIPDNVVQFSYAEGTFVPVEFITNYVVAYERLGTYVHISTDEAKEILIEQGIDPTTLLLGSQTSIPSEEKAGETGRGSEAVEGESLGEDETSKGQEEEEEEEEEELDEEDVADEGERTDEPKQDDEDEGPRPVTGKKLTNQFNFCERAALTYNLPNRCQESQTVPPPMANFSANVLQWVIYDAYAEDFEEQQLEKERERERKEKDKVPIAKAPAQPTKKKPPTKGFSEEVQMRIQDSWKVLERMINMNTYDDIAKDYRYWEDPSDEYREDEGTLLPLWKYSYDKTKRHTVTHLAWNPWYYDLFIVCFGFLDFMKPLMEGYVCLFTMKNPSFPETICTTASAVMCSDIHPKYPYMMICGLFDGNIVVYNIQASNKQAAYMTKSYENKHTGIVWSVKWAPDLPDGELNFYSVAGDGKVNNYILMQNELSTTTIINLYLERDSAPGPDGTLVKMIACATYIAMHPSDPHIYLVGTEEGIIYKCSTNYSGQYLLTYMAHHMPVYKIHYNKYNTDIFISCSGDWRIKIWEDSRLDPLFVFDLGSSIMDVEWAPHSSTVFAGVTTDGKVNVFDLNLNKYKPVCIQAVVSKKRNKLTTIAFNYNLPIIVVGDDKGMVTSLKLSPNLRIPCKPPKKQLHLDQWTLQCMKLDKLLALVREPAVLEVNMEVPVSDVS